jgi:glycosyltransferase involved in cell wall biosynthesis
MRVALDVTPIGVANTGVARYTAELLRELPSHGVDVRTFAVGRIAFPLPPGTQRMRLPLRVAHRLWLGLRWPKPAKKLPDIDVLHSADLMIPPASQPVVATMQDLAAVDRPDLHPRRSVVAQQRRLEQLDRVAVVLAISQATADALVRHGLDRRRIVVTPLGLSPTFAASVPSDDGFRGSTVLAVGELTHRKGLDVLIDAFARIDRPATRLVIVGPDGPAAAALREQAARSGAPVQFAGAVSDAALAGWYRRASVFCAASRAEGFGLPVLEAMAGGVPAIVSDIDVFREVTGGCAWLFRVDDAEGLAEKLRGLLDDQEQMQRLSDAGRTRASTFTWERTAAATARAYETATQ